MSKALGIDVGGTKIAIRAFEWDKKSLAPLTSHETRYQSSDKNRFLESLAEYTRQQQATSYDFVGIGFGGPVEGLAGDQQAHMTNLGWSVNTAEIEKIFPKAQVYLANDMKTHGWGALSCDSKLLLSLNPAARSRPGNAAFIAAGTGLGESIIAFAGGKMHPLAGEGGHASFSPVTEFDMKLNEFLRSELKSHVSWEKILGGRDGFFLLTRFMMGPGSRFAQGEVSPQLRKQVDDHLDVGKCLLEDSASGNSFAKSVIKQYARLYGSEAGNLALKCVPYHGVFVGGGIGLRIAEDLKSDFLEGFLNKGRFGAFLEKIPVWLILDKDNGTRGAANACIQTFL